MPEKLEQVLFHAGILHEWEIPHETFLVEDTHYFGLPDLRHFLQHCPLVLLLVLLKSLRELFFCSAGETSFHDNYWGLSISFSTHP